MESSTLPDPAFAAAAADFVAFAGDTARTHVAVERIVDGKPVSRCPVYPNLTCLEHQKAADVAGLWIRGRYPTPTVIWSDGSGKELIRRGGVRKTDEVVQDARNLLAKLPGPRASREDYQAVGPAFRDAEAALVAERYDEAIRKFGLAVAGRVPALKAAAEEALAGIRRTGDKLLGEGRAYLDAGETKEARRYLDLLSREFAALDCGRQAAELLKSIPESK